MYRSSASKHSKHLASVSRNETGGKIEVSISSSFISAREVVDGLTQAGFQNAAQLNGVTAPHGLRFSAAK